MSPDREGEQSMPYVHSYHGHSEVANHLAAELCDLLSTFSEEARRARLEQVEAGTAPATPWEFSILHITYGALCANSMDPVYVEAPRGGWTPVAPCPRCREVHPGAA